MSTERTIDATKVTPSSMADGDVFVTTTAEGVLKRSDIDAVTSRLKELGVISGRNIVKNSYPDKDTTEYLVAQLDYTEELDVNDIITITFFGELGSRKERLMAIHGGGDGTRGSVSLSKIADGMYRGTLTVRKTDGFGYMNIYASPSSVVDTTKVRCVMVERGKTGSQMWTPAPEDVADLLANRGGVKSTLPTCYTSCLQSTEKGVQHERKSNGPSGHLEGATEHRRTRRNVLALHGRYRDAEKVECEPARKKEYAFKRHQQWQRRGYIQSVLRCSERPSRTRRVQYLRPNCLSRAKFIRNTDIYSVTCGKGRKDSHTSMYQRLLGLVVLFRSHKVYVTTPRRKEVVAA